MLTVEDGRSREDAPDGDSTDAMLEGSILPKVEERLRPPVGLLPSYSPVPSGFIELLSNASSRERVNTFWKIYRLGIADAAADLFLASRLSQMMRYFTAEDKAEVISGLISTGRSFRSLEYIYDVLRLCSSVDELESVVELVGEEKLLDLNYGAIDEIVARGGLLAYFRQIATPTKPSKFSSRAHLNRKLEEVREFLLDVASASKSNPDWAESVAAKNFEVAALNTLNYLDGAIYDDISIKEFREVLTAVIEEIAIELYFGLSLTVETRSGEVERRWSVEELRDIRRVLEAIPEGRIVFTPRLFEIRRVSTLDDEGATKAERRGNGVIAISDFAVNDTQMSAKYNGISSLQVNFCHEVGHAICQGKYYRVRVNSFNRLLGPADPVYDFSSFLEIAGWRAYEEGEFKILNDGLSVSIDGREYPLGVPVEDGKEWCVFSYQEDLNMLFRYRLRPPFNLFSLHPYARTDPWEDWAEAFSEFILIPERLKRFSPEKYLYFCLHFMPPGKDTQIPPSL
ncbi:MAG: hypothetical protein D6808_07840 [Candidatus Dadabacteria bacterium]|nr:MAG: hypothetical protein D6808_07840 [Candidatus Dadabacteria bacterium]